MTDSNLNMVNSTASNATVNPNLTDSNLNMVNNTANNATVNPNMTNPNNSSHLNSSLITTPKSKQ